MEFHEEAFEAAAEITAAVAEEADIELNAEGAEKAAEFFSVLYKRLAAVARGQELQAEKTRIRVKVCTETTEENTQPEMQSESQTEQYSESWACEEEVYE